MALVTVDTSVALPATLRPGGMARKFWVLLAFGALTYEAEHRKLDLDALRHEYEAIGGTLGGTQAAEALIAHAETQRAVLAAQLPHDAPDDWVAVGSRPLFDEYERKVREIGPRFDPQLDVADAHLLRRQMEAVCVAAAPPLPPGEVPAFTRDPSDDPIVYGALLAGADYLVSDDKHIVPRGEPCEYEHDGRRLLAAPFGYVVSELMPDIAWGEIDGTLLSTALASPGPRRSG
jgi:predicted nucleic acid-binding protein